jgi:hypothetical protein
MFIHIDLFYVHTSYLISALIRTKRLTLLESISSTFFSRQNSETFVAKAYYFVKQFESKGVDENEWRIFSLMLLCASNFFLGAQRLVKSTLVIWCSKKTLIDDVIKKMTTLHALRHTTVYNLAIRLMLCVPGIVAFLHKNIKPLIFSLLSLFV